ncbi:Uu.00g090640.m01.CDS01 [Anthostomella pinea]|uniref:Uu.00g090640.m01.CDS01 n=1 Tax=Anthostomella pinea TaxID=933095 RepID=A0AAI8YKF3_9PEZI|nr:Uu.00g090640.m01.CDS01 [Anthostomella pinea]
MKAVEVRETPRHSEAPYTIQSSGSASAPPKGTVMTQKEWAVIQKDDRTWDRPTEDEAKREAAKRNGMNGATEMAP